MIDLAVLMSVYRNDRLSFVKESVDSILNQTYHKFHFYILFDGPVKPEVEKYITELTDERVRLNRIDVNGGLAAALNFLLEIVLKDAEYKFIARMDADDISLPARFNKQREFLLNNSDISCVGSWYEEIDESGHHLSYRKLPVSHEDLKRRYYARVPFSHPSVMYRREMIEKAGYYPVDTILMEDNVLWGMALKAGLKLANIPEFLLKFRIDEKFFKRRSGLKYGWNFIITRFRVNKELDFPSYTYVLILMAGIIKMMPPFLLSLVYKAARRN